MRTSIPALLLASAALAACATVAPLPDPGPVNPLARLPTQQHAAVLVDGRDDILLAPSGVLSVNQAAALGELAMRWTEDGGVGPIDIAAGPGPAQATAAAAAQLLVNYGVPASAVRLAATAPGAAAEPVRVGFARLEAVLTDCASRWGELTRTRNNEVHANFGCAVNNNMAAQAANPRDLLQPRGEAPADGERRADVINKYRKGQPTGSQRGADERGVVSGAIQ